MSFDRTKAMRPEDVQVMIAERAARGDAAGVAALYEDGAVMAAEGGAITVGRGGIEEAWSARLTTATPAAVPTDVAVVRCGDIALVSTTSPEETGARMHVVRRQDDGSWLRIIDQPEAVTPLLYEKAA